MDTILQDIANTLQARFSAEPVMYRDQIQVFVPAEHIIEAATMLRDEHGFVFLSDETAVDYYPDEEPRFHVLYQLRNLEQKLHLMLRVRLNGNTPVLPSMAAVYPNANWFEREIWDLFGIKFEGHPDMRRIIMPYDWQGHPLRKDYPLGYEEVQFTFNVDEVMMRKTHPRE